MNIQIDELMRIHSRLLDIHEQYKNNFSTLTNELSEISTNVGSSTLTGSITRFEGQINSTTRVLNTSMERLCAFLKSQMSLYSVTNEEALKALNELIAVLNGGLNVGILNNVSANVGTGDTSTVVNVNAGGPGSSTYDQSLLPTDGTRVNIPSGMGWGYDHMGWQCITSKSSNQYKLREAYGMNFDEQGIGLIDGRWVVATTTKYGNVGDALTVELANGQKFGAIIGDIKNQNDAGCNEWGHRNGGCVIEFVVDKNQDWWGYNGGTKTFAGTYPEYNSKVVSVINTGHYDF